ncbi:PRA1 family protein [Leishmania donovani]|nr:PRA1 family protein [Leishmania donovani]
MSSSNASDSPMLGGRLQGASDTNFDPPASMSIEETPSFSSAHLECEHMRQLHTPGISAATSGQRRGGHGGSVSCDSCSDLYSEGESEDSDLLERPGNMALPAFQHNRQRLGAHENRSALRAPQSPQAIQSEKRGGSDSSRFGAKRTTCSLGSIPVSYFSSSNVKSFAFRDEIGCHVQHLRNFYKMIEDDRLPWMTDFADIHKMELPRKAKEIAWRLNLNIPYYSSNYIEIFYVVTMPLLFVCNTPFFVVTFLAIVIIHSIRMHKKKTHEYGDSVVVLGQQIRYRQLGHLLVFAFVMLLMFFNGLRTLLWVLLLNVCIIVPHALMRKPTYFDDEDLEKCRPKMVQYAICLVILVLAYLEGDLCADEAAESRRAVERERKRVAQAMAKR